MNPYRDQGQAGFILRFALSMAVLTVVYSHLEPLFGYTYLYPLSLSVAALLDLVGVPTVLALYLDQGFCELQMERNVFLVEYECAGVFPLCIYLGTVGVYSATLEAKVRGVVLGIPSFFAYAVVRLLGLGLIGHLAPSWLEFFHVYLMVALNLGFLFFLWFFWVNHWTIGMSKSA